MWGNNVTPATDLPEEIMKVIAWDITEKNLGALGSASIEENANTRRLIFITESVASALSTKYKSKSDLENALIENARRPLWMRTFAYYYANTGGALKKSFNEVYNELRSDAREDVKITASPAWMNGITYSNIETAATMTKGNTDIIVTGDSPLFSFMGLEAPFSQLDHSAALAAIVVYLVLGSDTDGCHIILIKVFLCLLFAVAQSKSCMVITIFILVICKKPILHSFVLSPRVAG